MTSPNSPAGSQQAAVDAALLVLKSMGLSLDDLTAAPRDRAAVPTFAVSSKPRPGSSCPVPMTGSPHASSSAPAFPPST